MSVLLHQQQVDDTALVGELGATRSTKGNGSPPPKGRHINPKEGVVTKIHDVAALVVKGGQRSPAPPDGLPKEGSSGQGRSIHCMRSE